MNEADPQNFTHILKRLEEIVKQLENPELDLDEGLKLLEEGIKLHKICTQKLNQAQIKIKEILKDNNSSQTSETA